MKIAYLVYFDIDDNKMLGVKKKILAQIKALTELDNDVTLVFRRDNQLILMNNQKEVDRLTISKGATRYKSSISKIVSEYLTTNNFDLLYLRFPNSLDYSVLKLLNSMRNKKIVFEIPTYPIKGEYLLELKKLKESKRFKEYCIKVLVFLQHWLCTKIIKKYLKHIVTYMDFDEIWKIPVIRIDNGVDTSTFEAINFSKEKDIFTIIGVANISKWHGFDRVIRGLTDYKENVVFKIIGDGDEKNSLVELSKALKVEGKVEFLGPLFGEELIKLYEESNIAISSLGMHRIGLVSGSTIKTKEYCSLGIPFIYSYDEKQLSNDFKYALKVDASENPIDLNSVKKFYDNIKNDNYSNTMHEYAQKNYDWNVQMKLILNEVIDDE